MANITFISLGWNIAQEKFFESLSNTVNHLKLRFSYGKLGNQNTTDYYPTYRKMTYSPGAGSWLQEGVKPNTAQVGSLISTELTWESVSSYNLVLIMGYSIIALPERSTILYVILRIWWDLLHNYLLL